MTQTAGLLSYLPFLLVSGIVCGSLTGQIAQQTSARLRYYRTRDRDDLPAQNL